MSQHDEQQVVIDSHTEVDTVGEAAAAAATEVAAAAADEDSNSSPSSNNSNTSVDDTLDLDTATAQHVAHPSSSSAESDGDDDDADVSESAVDGGAEDAQARLAAFLQAAMAADPKLETATNAALDAMTAPHDDDTAAAAAAATTASADSAPAPTASSSIDSTPAQVAAKAQADDELQKSVQEIQDFIRRQQAEAAARSAAAEKAAVKAAKKAAWDAKVAARQNDIRSSRQAANDDEEEEDDEELSAAAEPSLRERLARMAEEARADNRNRSADAEEDDEEEDEEEVTPTEQGFAPWLRSKVAATWSSKGAQSARNKLRWGISKAISTSSSVGWGVMTAALILLPPLLLLDVGERNHLHMNKRVLNVVSDEATQAYIIMGEVPPAGAMEMPQQ